MRLPDNVNSLAVVIFIGLLTLSPLAQSKTSDTEQPLNIEADSVEIREKQGISIYRGHVKISRGSMLIRGKLIYIHTNNNKLQKIRVEGLPATFRQLNDMDEEISAQSHEMEYLAATGILTLKKKAILVQSHNQISSEHIIYDTKNDIVQAGDKHTNKKSANSKPERVTITIHPDKSKQQKAQTSDDTSP